MNPPTGCAGPRALHELRWLLLSPPLLSTEPGAHPAVVQSFDAAERSAIEHWLGALAHDAEGLARLEAAVDGPAPTRRLGRRAERLMAHYLAVGPTHRLVAAHLPLTVRLEAGGRRTVGEIDFLVEDAHGGRWHWELAVKFYLWHPPADGGAADLGRFVGPEGRDTLEAKLQKLFGEQLRHAVPDVAGHAGARWQPAACVRGWLFYPGDWHGPMPGGLNPGHARGVWMPPGEPLPPGAWRRLDHAEWLAAGWPDAGAEATDVAAEAEAGAQRTPPGPAAGPPRTVLYERAGVAGVERLARLPAPPG